MTQDRKLTLTEIGVILSLLISVGGLIFTAGTLYGQVKNNTIRIDKIEPKVDAIEQRIERIDTNVEWLRQQREK